MNFYKSLLFLSVFLIRYGYAQTDDVNKLVVDPVYSTIQFSVPISNGLTRVTGKFTEFTIDVDFVSGDLTKSRIEAII
jgi:polyisoprenoid-binding protein YceI